MSDPLQFRHSGRVLARADPPSGLWPGSNHLAPPAVAPTSTGLLLSAAPIGATLGPTGKPWGSAAERSSGDGPRVSSQCGESRRGGRGAVKVARRC